MSNYERDYSDFRSTPFHEHGDEIPSNHSTNPTMYDVIDARASRRGFLVGGLAALATGLFGAGLSPRAVLAQTSASSGLLGFAAVPLSQEDAVVVPEGYKVPVLAPWGSRSPATCLPSFRVATPALSRACKPACIMTGCTFTALTALRLKGFW